MLLPSLWNPSPLADTIAVLACFIDDNGKRVERMNECFYSLS